MQELSQREVELLDALEYARDTENEDAIELILSELRFRAQTYLLLERV